MSNYLTKTSHIPKPIYTYNMSYVRLHAIAFCPSKYFSEILLICVNFLVTAHGSICIPRQNVYFLF